MFLVDELPSGDLFVLDGPEGHHAATVQRLTVGEQVILGDGRGGKAGGAVVAVRRGELDISVHRRWHDPQPTPKIAVVQALAKGDRGELAVQAMTEVGVDEIIPWAAARSVTQWKGERGERARGRWQATAREATKQSERAWLPEIAALAATAGVAAQLGAARAFVLDPTAGSTLGTVPIDPAGRVTLIVGPEGGITPEESALFEAAGAQPVRLGTNILRTSTAGVVAIAILQTRLTEGGADLA